MNNKTFIDSHITYLMEKDADVRKCFERAKTEQEKTLLKKGLEQSLETAYQSYAKEYFESKGIGSYVTKLLRWGALGADLAGTYMFWALGGAGFGLKGVGALAKIAAEYFDNKHYEKYRKKEGIENIVSKDGLQIAGEGAGQIIAGYLPLGGEMWAFLRGTKKYDEKIVAQALSKAKSDFIKRFAELQEANIIPATNEPRLVPVREFYAPAYSKAA